MVEIAFEGSTAQAMVAEALMKGFRLLGVFCEDDELRGPFGVP